MSKTIPKLNGLVLAGGKSSRMGREKALIAYHGLPQGRFCYQMLNAVCEHVYLSGRAEQLAEPEFQASLGDLPMLTDDYAEIGPLSGLLTAMEQVPGCAWLVLACDMPLVDAAVIQALMAARNPDRLVTVFEPFRNQSGSRIEPLCAVYEPACLLHFRNALERGNTGLRFLLRDFEERGELQTARLPKSDSSGNSPLLSINTMVDYEQWQSL